MGKGRISQRKLGADDAKKELKMEPAVEERIYPPETAENLDGTGSRGRRVKEATQMSCSYGMTDSLQIYPLKITDSSTTERNRGWEAGHILKRVMGGRYISEEIVRRRAMWVQKEDRKAERKGGKNKAERSGTNTSTKANGQGRRINNADKNGEEMTKRNDSRAYIHSKEVDSAKIEEIGIDKEEEKDRAALDSPRVGAHTSTEPKQMIRGSRKLRRREKAKYGGKEEKDDRAPRSARVAIKR
ncbi:hypothetical protein DFH09DRAFT_1094837 [Mycena vulgaris]|nr:hypothetical protein DFH09DRAFT_1094837 [Mycena vulgaris]